MRTQDLIFDNLKLTAVVMLVCLLLGYGAGSVPVIAYSMYASAGPHARSQGGVTDGSRAVDDHELQPYRDFRGHVTRFWCLAGLVAAQTSFLATRLQRPPTATGAPENN